MMKIAIIPARKGSKRFPGKNKALLGGKPLISWTIESVLSSMIFDFVVFSSDCPDMLQIAGGYSGITIHKRPSYLAGDDVTTAQVTASILENYNDIKICGLFMPTCPFRSSDDIIAAVQNLDASCDSVISMKKMEIIPDFLFRSSEEYLAKPIFGDFSKTYKKTRIQEHEPVFYPNGAIYLAHYNAFIEKKTFYLPKTRQYFMPAFRSVDIDTIFDFQYAEFILQSGVIKF